MVSRRLPEGGDPLYYTHVAYDFCLSAVKGLLSTQTDSYMDTTWHAMGEKSLIIGRTGLILRSVVGTGDCRDCFVVECATVV